MFAITPRDTRSPGIIAGLVLLLSACGSGEAAPDPSTSAQGDAPTAEAVASNDPTSLPLPRPSGERQIGARLSEYEIELTRETVPAGEIEFHVVNAGTTMHYLVVRSETVYALTRHLTAGESDTLRVELEPGEYQYLCTIRDEFDHYSEGMRGTLVVR